MMRILYLSPRTLWPLNSGACLRDYHLLRELASRASVSFFGLSKPDDYDSPPGTARPDFELDQFVVMKRGRSYTGWKLLRGLLGPTPISVLNYQHRGVATELRRLLDEEAVDLVQMEGIHLFSYLPIIRSARSQPLVVCDWHDIQSELMHRYGLYTASWTRRLYAMRTARLLEKMERQLVMQCDAHVVVSERDQLKIRGLAPKARVHVVENGVDVARCSGVEKQPRSAGLSEQSAEVRKDIVFVGSMDSPANIDAARYFALEIWPRIHAKSPELRFLIVGSRPVAEVLELANLPGITVTGTVEDVRPYYHHALAAVVPLRIAGGTRLKILEAMAIRVPVISTSIGAEGLAVTPGRDILIANTPLEMTDAIGKLGVSREIWHDLSEAGHALVERRYDWSVIGSQLHEIYRTLLAHE